MKQHQGDSSDCLGPHVLDIIVPSLVFKNIQTVAERLRPREGYVGDLPLLVCRMALDDLQNVQPDNFSAWRCTDSGHRIGRTALNNYPEIRKAATGHRLSEHDIVVSAIHNATATFPLANRISNIRAADFYNRLQG